MVDNTVKQQEDSTPFYPTDLNAQMRLSTVQNYTLTRTTPWELSFAELASAFSVQPPVSPVKQGAAFLSGPCIGSRRDVNMGCAYLAVLDADSSLGADGAILTGAPDFETVHQMLDSWRISHVLYTTYSHRVGKGDRYRILFPTYAKNKFEILALLSYVVSSLNASGIPIALTEESAKWTQPWQLPKRSAPSAPYACRVTFGYSLNGEMLAKAYGIVDYNGVPIQTQVPKPVAHEQDQQLLLPYKVRSPSVISQFNERFSALQWLEAAGYKFVGQSIVINDLGEPQLTYRYQKPNSSSTPGVIAFIDPHNQLITGEPNYCVYSHHTNDPLSNGRANDSFACFTILNDLEQHQALIFAARLVNAAVAEWLNEWYPSVLDGGSFKVLVRCVSENTTYYSKSDWHSFAMATVNLPPVPIITNREGADILSFKPIPDYWKSAPERITYQDALFKPWPLSSPISSVILNGPGGQKYFNTFPGWGITPEKGSWTFLAEHLKYAICGGNDTEYQYLLSWFAHLVQRPYEKPGVAIILKGGKGWGKSIIAHALSRKLGRIAMILSNNKQLTGQFNDHLANCLLAVVEESFWAGSHQQEGMLKQLISDVETSFEGKGKTVRAGESYLRLIIPTNETWAAPASADERRYFVPTLTDYSLKKDIINGEKGHFFPLLLSELYSGGIEAFFYDMLERKVSLKDVINVPETKGLQEQRAYSLGPIQSWVYTFLRDGRIMSGGKLFLWSGSGMSIPDPDLTMAATETIPQQERGRNFSYLLFSEMSSLFGNTMQRASGRTVFEPLPRCREQFLRHTKLPVDSFDGSANALDDYGSVTKIRRG